MDIITIEYFNKEENGHKYICMKTIDTNWSGAEGFYLFMETAESLLKSSYTHICYDLSNLKFISSSYLGVIMNLVTQSKELKKLIKFKFNKECIETIKAASIDKVITIEEV